MKKVLLPLALALLLTVPGFAAEDTVSLLEEEWTAQDLYKSLYEETGEELYGRLYQAELRHEKALVRLLEGTGGELPVRKASELPKTVEEKIAFAIEFEKQDIEELKKAAEKTDDPGAKRVFANLAKVSESHLAALLGEKDCPQNGEQMRQFKNRDDSKGMGMGQGRANAQGGAQGRAGRQGLGQGQQLQNCDQCENCPRNE